MRFKFFSNFQKSHFFKIGIHFGISYDFISENLENIKIEINFFYEFEKIRFSKIGNFYSNLKNRMISIFENFKNIWILIFDAIVLIERPSMFEFKKFWMQAQFTHFRQFFMNFHCRRTIVDNWWSHYSCVSGVLVSPVIFSTELLKLVETRGSMTVEATSYVSPFSGHSRWVGAENFFPTLFSLVNSMG